MVVGNWGTEIIFRVSEKQVLTLQNINRTVGSEWATHSRIGKKDQSEYLRPKLQQVTFSIELNAILGVRPRAMLDRLAALSEGGAVLPLVVGGKRIGRNRWCMTDVSEAWDTTMTGGELVKATVNVTMREYL